MYKFLILMSCFVILGASKCEHKKEGAECSDTATLKDFTGLDGCGFLIVLDNGEKLQAVKYHDNKKIQLKDGQRIKIGYKEVDNQMSICMAGKMVEVTCIEFLESSTTPSRPAKTGGIKPVKMECVETLDPYYNDWMLITLEKTNAYQVVRYTYRTDGFAYYFLGSKGNMVVDCQGTIICECDSRETKCDDVTKNFTDELVIWEKD